MNDQTFEIGRRYWLDDGAEVILQARTDDGQFVVAPVLIVTSYRMSYDGPDEYDHEEPGPAILVSALNCKAPVEKKDAAVAKLDQQIAAKRQELEAVGAEIRQATSERDQIMKRLSDVPALRFLDDFIAGRFTHVVYQRSGYIVLTTAEALKDTDYDGRHTWRDEGHPWKLLSLFGKSGGDLQFRLNSYRDGSGAYRDVWLFMSETEARAFAIEKTKAYFGLIQDNIDAGKQRGGVSTELLKDARALGMEIPPGIRQHQISAQKAAMAERIRQHQKVIDETNAEMAQLMAEEAAA